MKYIQLFNPCQLTNIYRPLKILEVSMKFIQFFNPCQLTPVIYKPLKKTIIVFAFFFLSFSGLVWFLCLMAYQHFLVI